MLIITRLRVAVAAVGLALLVGGMPSPASAASCKHSYDSDGYIVWGTGCSVVASPGRAGPLRMGKTTVSTAKKKGYLAYSRACTRWDGFEAGPDWRSKSGKLVGWTTSGKTSRGLTSQDSLQRALQLYPGAQRSGFMPNAYVDDEGWDIYSVAGASGWLDIYSYNNLDSRVAGLFFAVRAKSVKRPVISWSQDGC